MFVSYNERFQEEMFAVGDCTWANTTCVFPSSPPLTAFPKAISPTEARVRLVQMGNQWLHRESY